MVKSTQRPFLFYAPPKTFYIVITICTVDLEIPNFPAAARTVARFSMMYWASCSARSSMFPFKKQHSPPCVAPSYAKSRAVMYAERAGRSGAGTCRVSCCKYAALQQAGRNQPPQSLPSPILLNTQKGGTFSTPENC